jgi:hypothetical protein
MASEPNLRESIQNGAMIAGLFLGKMFRSQLSIGVVSQVRKRRNYGRP